MEYIGTKSVCLLSFHFEMFPGSGSAHFSGLDYALSQQMDPESPPKSGSVDRAELDRHCHPPDVDLKTELEPRNEGEFTPRYGRQTH